MRKLIALFAAFVFMALASSAFALAFPGALGYGANATGGRGGTIIHVTNLNDSGAGSLREAVGTSGARIIVFDVSGTIQLNSNIVIPLNNGNMTIAGQTSPGGICLARASLTIMGSNVIVRGLAIRPGDSALGSDPSNRDAVQIENYTGTGVSNVVIDHCSLTWSVDEVLTTWHPLVSNITVSNTIMSEALYNSIHPDGNHGMGPYLGAGTTRVTMFGNLISNNQERNPLTNCDQLEFINNATYNRMNHLVRILNYDGDVPNRRTNVINNYFIRGPDWSGSWPVVMLYTPDIQRASTYVYISGNNITTYPTLFTPGSPYVVQNPAFSGTGIIPLTATAAKAYVIDNVGARPWDRDAVDTRLVQQIVSGSGGAMVNSPSDVGGYPTLTGTAATDTDSDGMPDWWETQHGLNPNSASDAHTDIDSDGWDNIEEYINQFYTPETPEEPPPGPPDPGDIVSHPQTPSRARISTYGQSLQVTSSGRTMK